MEARPATVIVIDPVDPSTTALWTTVAKIARPLEQQEVRWCLVGGLMVALFAIESGQAPRVTTDIDLLGDARQQPSGTESLSRHLERLGATLHEVGGFDREKGFRFEVDGQVVDVLAPEGLGRPALTKRPLRSIEIPGGSQALQRRELVEIVVREERASLFRPTLLGAILLKARSLKVHDRPKDQRQDLITLLGLMTDPRPARETMTQAEVKWLRVVDGALHLDDAELDAIVEPVHLRIARAAYRRLSDTAP